MKQILEAVRSHLNSSGIRLPSQAESWTVDGDQLRAVINGSVFGKNIQEIGPSIPCYQLALCYWYEQATGDRLNAVLELVGDIPATLHGNRARFMLTELDAVAGDRLNVKGLQHWQLPDYPVMNAPREVRKNNHKDRGNEHNLEVSLTQLATTPMGKLQRQFPLGLFDGQMSDDTRLFPGGAAQADLWSFDDATKTFNLVELKADDNAAVGIIPESLTYARLLQRFVAHPESKWSEEWDGARAMRQAERVVVWLVAEKFHPLVFSQGTSPLVWLNEGPERDGLVFRVLPIDVQNGEVRWGDVWPAS